MGKYLGPKIKITKREGINLFLKKNCKINFKKKVYKKKSSDFKYQLREKQKVKIIYGILENQFRNYYKKSIKLKGDTGKNLLKILESRLDNVIYRMGFSKTRLESRQLVNHKFFKVNNKKVNIPSYILSPKDKISLCNKYKNNSKIINSLKTNEKKSSWLKVDVINMIGVFIRLPKRSEIYSKINEALIIEYYSK